MSFAAVTHAQENGPDYFVEAVIDNPTPFVGERITYSFRFYNAVLLEDCDDETVVGCPQYVPPEFQDFWQQDVEERDALPDVAFLNDRQYSVQTIDTYLYPTRAGELTIAPASLVFPESVFRPEQAILTQAITIQAVPLPEGAPDGYNGAVGQFEMRGTIDRQSLPFGDPLRLTITVTGIGNLEQMTPPEIPVDTTWRIYDSDTIFIPASENPSQQTDTRIFEWLLVPSEAGSQILPAIDLHYFDPTVRNYRTISTTEITLDIIPPADGQPENLPPSSNTNLTIQRQALPLKAINANITTNSNNLAKIIFALMWVFPPIVFVAASVWGWRNRPHRRTIAKQNISALKHARRRLSAARKQNTVTAHRLIGEAIFAYFAAQLQIATGELNTEVMREAMRQRDIPNDMMTDLFACLDTAHQVQFTPNAANNSKRLIDRTNQTLMQIDRFWKQQ